MVGQFVIADILIKMGMKKKVIILIESIFLIVAYALLLSILYKYFHSILIIISEIILLLGFYLLRIHYLKKYLNRLEDKKL